MAKESSNCLLDVTDLAVHYRLGARALSRSGYSIRAVDGVSFEIRHSETLGLVGESGCGKSTTGRAILRLVQPTSGSIKFDGRDVTREKGKALKEFRRQTQAVFQDPYDSINPRMTVGSLIAEPLLIHNIVERKDVRKRVGELLELVGLKDDMAKRRPAAFSGGQRQRIGIARALAVEPKLIICDEAVSALDVSVQAKILNVFRRLKRDFGLSYLFIGHDLGVVRHVSERIAVMYLGQLVESADTNELYNRPYHPYTISLLASSPVPDPSVEKNRSSVPVRGDPPSPSNIPSGCRFAPRCPFAQAVCWSGAPEYSEVEPGHWVACHFWQDMKMLSTEMANSKEKSF